MVICARFNVQSHIVFLRQVFQSSSLLQEHKAINLKAIFYLGFCSRGLFSWTILVPYSKYNLNIINTHNAWIYVCILSVSVDPQKFNKLRVSCLVYYSWCDNHGFMGDEEVDSFDLFAGHRYDTRWINKPLSKIDLIHWPTEEEKGIVFLYLVPVVVNERQSIRTCHPEPPPPWNISWGPSS